MPETLWKGHDETAQYIFFLHYKLHYKLNISANAAKALSSSLFSRLFLHYKSIISSNSY